MSQSAMANGDYIRFLHGLRYNPEVLSAKERPPLLTTIIYILGALSLHFTDVHSQSDFTSLFLPMANILFFIFLVWQLLFYFSLSTFSHDDSIGFFDLLYHFWHLDTEIARVGFVSAVVNFCLMLLNAVSLFIAVFYYLEMFLDLVRI